ncbi:MBL fold metallo-hydrolase [Paenibacillus sp. CAA11]|uniref:MBL fold metallo-hydrolase n=1 Tax=Paenibacillus sp. CAA11 TaxID=1532905 RepID=UPI000D36A317|nr:MBL fold metallo-hydrolase [Paenibacillus sp. CAA11]AWB45788.1 MBL fold metallo-hydrolase [Paenibacillus sp. CAA11]
MILPEWVNWEDGKLVQVRISLSSPLRWVNSYLLYGEDGRITLVDPGPRSPQIEAEWREVCRALQIVPQQISSIVVTHHHPDHYGLAGWMQQRTGAAVRMSRRCQQEAELMWGKNSRMNDELPLLYRRHGLPDELMLPMLRHLEGFFSEVHPAPQVSYIAEGEGFEMGGRSWIPYETGGHASGHLSFYDPASGSLLCGDAVLPQISPNISYLPGGDPAPLRSFLAGLKKIEPLMVTRAYPGHRHPFTHYKERIAALLQHHEDRLNRLIGLLAGGPLTAYELHLLLFGSKLTLHQLRFAMSEVLAHLVELEHRERVSQDWGRGDVLRYRLAD